MHGNDLREYPTVERAAAAILDAASVQDVATTLLSLTLQRMGGSSGAVLLLDGQTLSPVAIAMPKSPNHSTSPQRPQLGFGPEMIGLLRTTEDPVFVPDDRSGHSLDTPRPVWIPLKCRGQLIGALYVEDAVSAGNPQSIGVVSLFASQAASSLTQLRLSDALMEESRLRRDAEDSRQEIYDSMLKHQRIGKMGDFRFNTRTLLSKGSSQCYQIFGYEDGTDVVQYDLWMERLHPDDRLRVHEEMAAAFAKQVPLRFEYRIINDGEVRHILSEGHPEFDRNGDLLYCGVVVDVTEQKAAENVFATLQAELSAALRLASIGELAGSVVHEVNQPLTAMITNADACRRWLSHDPANVSEAREAAGQVVSEGERAIAVMTGLEALARGAQIRLGYLQLNDVILEVLTLMRTPLERSRVQIRSDLDFSIPKILGDRTQLQQVVFNMVRNGVDAMKSVHDRTRSMTISSWRSDSDEVIVAVRDSGTGVDTDRLEGLFDPLFTTKQEGLGLGLSISRRIIRAHHGRIWAEKNNEFGLTVNFALPISVQP